jgi:[acyl-carrier-protein] S-malonyltransferase
MSQIAFVFPGQGSQTKGMGKELCDSFLEARSVFEEADRVLGFPISQLCFEGPEDRLRLTENTQPAILAVSVAAFRVLSAKGIQPLYLAGHSLGEYSALVAANSLNLADALRTVRNRGRYMQEAVPVGQGAMAAILGLSEAQVADLCKEASRDEVLSPANLNSPVQIVIAGSVAAVRRALELAKDRGAKKAVLLPVSAPFHCHLMQSAQDRLSQELAHIRFQDLEVPLINNADVAELRCGAQVAEPLSRQVCAPVRWTETVQKLIGLGIRVFVEVGPGKVLCGLVRQVDRRMQTAHVEDLKSLNEALAILGHQN